MKWAKSRKSKKSRQLLGVGRARRRGGASASSATIRGEADPTWWTCSSALGRPAMKGARLTPRSVAETSARPSGRRSPAACSPSTTSPSTQHRRGRVHAGSREAASWRRRPSPRRPCPRCRADVGLGRARLDGQVDQVVGVGEGAGSRRAGCRRAGRGRPWRPRDRTRRGPPRRRWRPRASSRRCARGS